MFLNSKGENALRCKALEKRLQPQNSGQLTPSPSPHHSPNSSWLLPVWCNVSQEEILLDPPKLRSLVTSISLWGTLGGLFSVVTASPGTGDFYGEEVD